MKILIINEDKKKCDALAEHLESINHTVVKAVSIETAKRQIGIFGSEFDLIISDIDVDHKKVFPGIPFHHNEGKDWHWAEIDLILDLHCPFQKNGVN